MRNGSRHSKILMYLPFPSFLFGTTLVFTVQKYKSKKINSLGLRYLNLTILNRVVNRKHCSWEKAFTELNYFNQSQKAFFSFISSSFIPSEATTPVTRFLAHWPASIDSSLKFYLFFYIPLTRPLSSGLLPR